MPIIWRYLATEYLKMALFCVAAFVAILLTVRLDEIAHFIALGAPIEYVAKFTFYQIPYILPIAIPLSCLIASLILVQRLSATHELTALRASGFGLRDLLAPILISALLLSILNFWIVSEAATHSHMSANQLKNELRAINPILLLHNKHLMRLKGIYFEAMGTTKVGESVADVVLAIPDKHNKRLSLLLAKEMKSSPDTFATHKSTMISALSTPQNDEEGFDSILVENIGKSETSVQDFGQILQKKVWSINNDYLGLPLLLARIEELRKSYNEARLEGNEIKVKELRAEIGKSLADIARRGSIALGVFAFTLMGAAFGIQIGRQRKTRSLYIVISLTTLYLVCFFAAKGLDKNWGLATALYLVPLTLLIIFSIWSLNRTSRGIE